MEIGLCNALALMLWRGFRSFNSSVTSEDLAWLLIGVVLTVIVYWVIRRRRRWF
jgi:small-conductance mechanosensitive channel